MLSRKIKIKVRSLFPDLVDAVQRRLGRKDKSYAGEFGVLRAILNSLSIDGPVRFVDIGAGDGYNMSVAYPLSNFFSGEGLLIESNEALLEKAKSLYKNNSGFYYHNDLVNPFNISEIIRDYGFQNSTYIKIDIDSFDLDLLRAILESGLKPKVLSVEINELFPPPVIFESQYDPNGYYSTPFYGCSLQALVNETTKHKYKLVALAFNNAFLVHNEDLDTHYPFLDQSPIDIFQNGFLNSNWSEHFPWHKKHDFGMPVDELVRQLSNEKNFSPRFMKLLIEENF